MKITVVGSGYVGLVSGACFANLGNEVTCVDIDAKKIALLKKGVTPIYEPGLEELVRHNLKEKNLSFTTDLKGAVRRTDVIFIAVGTPPRPNGEADLSFVEDVARTIAKDLRGYKLIVEKSTVPVQTGERLAQTLRHTVKKGADFDVASNPEFLREGSAVRDFMNPDRIILGVESKKAERILRELYAPLKAPIVVTDINSAEIIKHASNSFLATKISFINAIANVCDAAKADVEQVAIGIGLDRRIGRGFLDAGIGFGGFCFPKDLAAFIRISEKLGYDFELLRAVERINENQKKVFLKKVEEALWNVSSKTIGVLGLSFKPNTDDMRYAPSVEIIAALQAQGARVKAFDPHAMPKAKGLLRNVEFCKDSYSVSKGSDCLLILTEWDEFKELDLARVKKALRQPIVVDGRNIYDPKKMRKLGFKYFSMGRP
ncbi:MAG: UDP-glucose/GDP-mannose dehydrogenase family protein [Candidatus Omnitrophica bacterium]|nr:UDP-glucose/GDP-mannose dehydrogenase family protein [Candidatus Omnitrophota bacterium]